MSREQLRNPRRIDRGQQLATASQTKRTCWKHFGPEILTADGARGASRKEERACASLTISCNRRAGGVAAGSGCRQPRPPRHACVSRLPREGSVDEKSDDAWRCGAGLPRAVTASSRSASARRRAMSPSRPATAPRSSLHRHTCLIGRSSTIRRSETGSSSPRDAIDSGSVPRAACWRAGDC